MKRRMVWLCHGCDECDGPQPQVRPCDSPSSTGAWVVLASDAEQAVRDADTRARLEERERLVTLLRGEAPNDDPGLVHAITMTILGKPPTRLTAREHIDRIANAVAKAQSVVDLVAALAEQGEHDAYDNGWHSDGEDR